MKLFILIFTLLSAQTYAKGNLIVQCKGSLVVDLSLVTANVYLTDTGIGKVIIHTDIDSIEGEALVKELDKNSYFISSNKFQMYFEVSHDQVAVDVQAFRDGMFFVEDFLCKALK
jgi:hypothetical protein